MVIGLVEVPSIGLRGGDAGSAPLPLELQRQLIGCLDVVDGSADRGELPRMEHDRLLRWVLQHAVLRDEVTGTHFVDQTVLQVINEAQPKVGCIVFLGQVVGGKSVAGPEHHAQQVVEADSLGPGQEFNDDGFAGLTPA